MFVKRGTSADVERDQTKLFWDIILFIAGFHDSSEFSVAILGGNANVVTRNEIRFQRKRQLRHAEGSKHLLRP